jgi:maleylacetoacetate isomerase/maleylpyruvate isomerase
MTMQLKLHSYFQSSTSYRARIALALKGLTCDYVAVNLRTGEHRQPGFPNATPALPMLEVLDGGETFQLGQSLAIIDWLDSLKPEPRLTPLEQPLRARVLEFANLVACDIHPVNNLRVLKYLAKLGIDEAARDTWYAHWIAEGLTGAETLLVRHGGSAGWCFGDAPTLADVCLIPQMANAIRTNCDLAPYPRLRAVWDHATAHPAFIAAAPQNQPDHPGQL